MGNNNGAELQRLYGTVSAGEQDFTRYGVGYQATVEVKQSFINNTITPLTVCHRSGIKYTLPVVPSLTSRDLVIRVEYWFQRDIYNSLYSLVSGSDENSSEEVKILRKAFECQVHPVSGGGTRLVLDYCLSGESLQKHGGTIYYSDIDVVISHASVEFAPHHPESEEGKRDNYATTTRTQPYAFIYSIEVVDNDNVLGPRFVCVAGKAHKLSNKKDINRRSGYYITCGVHDDRTVEYHDFTDDTEKLEESLRIYKSYEEAQTGGDEALLRKEKLTQLEFQNNTLKLELVANKQKADEETSQRERAMAELQHVLDVKTHKLKDLQADLDMVRTKVKDHYEHKSHVRKDTSESVKFIPTLLIGMVAAFTAFKAFF